MADPTFITGGFRPFEVNAPGGTAASIVMAEPRGGIKVAQSIPHMMQNLESGRVCIAGTGVVADGLAPVQDLPSTSAFAGVALYNGYTGGQGGKALLILSCSVYLCSGTPDVYSSVFGGIGTPSSAPTTTSGNYVKSASGSTYAASSSATFKSTPTMATTGPAWELLGASLNAATAKVGFGVACEFPQGKFLVPAGSAFCSVVLGSAGTTPLFGWTIRFMEVESYLV